MVHSKRQFEHLIHLFSCHHQASVYNTYFCVLNKIYIVRMFLHWNYLYWTVNLLTHIQNKDLHKNAKLTPKIAASPSCFCQWLLLGLKFWSRHKWLSEWVGRASLRAQRSINTNLWGIWARGNMHKLFLSGWCADVNEKTRRHEQTG